MDTIFGWYRIDPYTVLCYAVAVSLSRSEADEMRVSVEDTYWEVRMGKLISIHEAELSSGLVLPAPSAAW